MGEIIPSLSQYSTLPHFQKFRTSTAAGLAQSVERLTAEREVAGSIPGAGPILRVLKYLRNEGTVFALQTAGPSRDSDDGHVEMAVPSPVGDVRIVSPISTLVLNTLTLKKTKVFFFFFSFRTK